MQKRNVLIPVLKYLVPGTTGKLWHRRASAGLLGPLTSAPGKARDRTIDSEEFEKRFGAVSDEQFSAAVHAYEADRRLMLSQPR
jgi:hypothetical protein